LAAAAAASQPCPSLPCRWQDDHDHRAFTAGGPTDKVARDLAEAPQLNNATIVIDNADGAGSTIGTAKVARARPTATRCC
jgi:tripartite-type tricarboxylate transporter receptor subunit TctC